jgi:hypothetical protein
LLLESANRYPEDDVRNESEREPPFEGGTQPVPEHPPEMPQGGRSAMQVVVLVVGGLVVLAGLAWLLMPVVSR